MDSTGDGTKLKRDIGFAGSAFLAFNGVVGAGIFALPGTLYDQFGVFSPWLFPLFGGLILLVAVPFAQLAARFGITGGPVAYVAAAFGPAASFQVGWLYYIARVTAMAANSNVFVAYAATVWPALAGGAARIAAIVALLGLLTVVNIVGVKRAVRLLDALTFLKALPLLLMAIIGLVLFGGELRLPSAIPPLGEVEAAALLVLYAFIGFENLLVPAEETTDPRRTIPRAMLLTIGATIALYFLVQLAYVAASPATGGDAPLVAWGSLVAGGIGAAILTFAALFSLAGNLTGSMLVSPRVTFALARAGSLPGWFGRVSARYQTPANSIIFMGLVGIVLAVTGSFVLLAVVSTLSRLVVYAVSMAALPKLRRDGGEPVGGGIMGVVVLVGGFAVCGWAMAQSDWQSWKLLLAAIAAGVVLYVIARRGVSA